MMLIVPAMLNRFICLSDGAIKCRLNHSGERQKFYDEILSLLASMGSEQE